MKIFLTILLGLSVMSHPLTAATFYSSEEELVAATGATGPIFAGGGSSTGPLVVGDLSIMPGECATSVHVSNVVDNDLYTDLSAEPMSCFDIELALPVSVFGFTVHSWTGSSGLGDSTFDIRLSLDGAAIETLSFIAPASGSVFFGFETTETFNQIDITEVIGSDNGSDREWFGRFFIVGSDIVIGNARYHVTDIGEGSEATAIFNQGQVVGRSGGSRAFLWEEGIMQVLESNDLRSRATDINDAGTITGNIQGNQGRYYPALWENNLLIDIVDGSQGTALGVNQLGQVVGRSDITNNGAFFWDNGTLTTIDEIFAAHSINDHGQIVGDSILWQAGVATDLGFMPGYEARTQAFDINNRGVIVGDSDHEEEAPYDPYDPFGGRPIITRHAFQWSDGQFLDLGTLGGENSRVSAINERGQIVGMSELEESSYRQHAFLWNNDEMMDLNRLIPENTGWTLERAKDINDRGQIVGYGRIFNGPKRGFLLTPIPTRPVGAMHQIREAITEKRQALELLRQAIIKENRAIERIANFDGPDNSDALSQQELRQALQRVDVAITHEEHAQNDIEKSINQLNKALDILNQ